MIALLLFGILLYLLLGREKMLDLLAFLLALGIVGGIVIGCVWFVVALVNAGGHP